MNTNKALNNKNKIVKRRATKTKQQPNSQTTKEKPIATHIGK